MTFCAATRSRCHDVAMIFLKHPYLFTFGVALVLFYGCHWITCSGYRYPADYIQPSKLFTSGHVIEITDGSLEFLSDQLRSSSFKFVLFYAPWCAQSKRAAVGFNRAANLMKDEVKFIAINCWTGLCRQEHVLDSYPKLFAYHSGFNGVQYMGEYNPQQMVRFIYSIIKPIAYVGRMDDFIKLKGGAKGFVVSYFNSTALDSKTYSVFLSVALQSVGKASSPLFTMVTNRELAREVGVDLPGGIVFHIVQRPPIVYPSSANYTKAAILHWIESHSEELVVKLSASVTGRDHLARQLKRGPALILFLPLEQQKIYQPLMDVYTHAAQQFYNCSCNMSLHGVPLSGDSEKTDTDTLEVIEQGRPKPRQKVKKTIAKDTVASEDEKGSIFIASLDVQRQCQSVAMENDRRNVCDVCHTCQRLQGCSRLTDSKINRQELQKQILANTLITGRSCISLRNSYNLGVTISLCCVNLSEKKDSSEKSAHSTGSGALQSLMGFDVADANGVIDQWINRFVTLFQGSSKGAGIKLWNVKAQIDGDRVLISGSKEILPGVTTGTDIGHQKGAESLKKEKERGLDKDAETRESVDHDNNNDDDDDDSNNKKSNNNNNNNNKSNNNNDDDDDDDGNNSNDNNSNSNYNNNDSNNNSDNNKKSNNNNDDDDDDDDGNTQKNSSCVQVGHVAEFPGAGCLSNRSLNFFYMDSSQHWVVAERLGLATDNSRAKTGLVILDLKNEAQFVLDEALEITNESVVGFMMDYMSGSLQRRFTSSHHVLSTCSTPHACVVEVTTATFEATVLDNSKDVLLLYYAPWCGFCVSLTPAYLTVARFFENITEVRVARINADENDLSYEFVVTHYPSFILYPAGRKDFSVRFPDTRERTATNLIQFLLDHASERTHRAIYGHDDDDDACSKSDSYWTKIRELESKLQTTEEERAFLEASLNDAVKAKDYAEQKWDDALKEIGEAQFSSVSEKTFLRVAADYMNKKLDERLEQAEDTSFKAIAAAELFSKEVELMKDKLQAKEKQVYELLLEKSEWSQNMRVKHLALEHANADLTKRSQALLRMLRRLRRLLNGGVSHERTSSYEEHSEKLSRELEGKKSTHHEFARKPTTEAGKRQNEIVDFPEKMHGFRESSPRKPNSN